MTKASRSFWSLIPIACGVILPPLVAFWVNSQGLGGLSITATEAVLSDYSRPLGESLALTTLFQLPPFVVLALICFNARTTRGKLLALMACGLVLIGVVEIPVTVRILRRI